MTHLLVLTKPAKWVDPWGREHSDSKELIDVAEVEKTEDTYSHDNGYTVDKATVWQEVDGTRRWAGIVSIDYSGGTSYLFLPGENEQADAGYRWWSCYVPGMRLQRFWLIAHLPITNEQELRKYL